MEPALFRRWPGLRGRIHHHPLLGGPTPVERLALEGAPGGSVLVKRDERSCPLYGGTYGGDRMRTMEEVVRFYRYFGLRPDEETREPPDHLSAQLEFLHFLTYREAKVLLGGEDPVPLRAA